jgi:type IV secretion system protein VirB5
MKAFLSAVVLALLMTLSDPARAQWAVFDGASFAQLVQQVNYWQQQLQGMQRQIGTLQQTYSAMTGPRGMQALLPLSAQARNYLPPDFASLLGVLNQTSVTYAGLSTALAQSVTANAVLTPAALAQLSPAEQQLIAARRKNAALLQTLGQSALQTASARFTTLQGLITAIGNAQDEKAIADLQGRISAEQAMLANDQSKLETLYRLTEAQRWATEQRAQELGISVIGHASQLPAVNY